MLRGYMLRFQGGIPDQARADLIRESYRTIGARTGALVAKWVHEDPDSQELKNLEGWIKQLDFDPNEQSSKETLSAERVRDLIRFFEKRSELEEFVTPDYARRATEDFTRLYHHGAPFDSDQLIKLWGSCREGRQEPEWCREWAQKEARKLGSVGETELLERCLANRYVGAQCREGLESARRLVEKGKIFSLEN